jgi:hypothetical protein
MAIRFIFPRIARVTTAERIGFAGG